MTTLSKGMENLLARINDPNCEPRLEDTQQAAALIRAYEEERWAMQEFESMDFPPDETRARLSLAQITLHNLKAEIEKDG